jgi:hypothetical protein
MLEAITGEAQEIHIRIKAGIEANLEVSVIIIQFGGHNIVIGI